MGNTFVWIYRNIFKLIFDREIRKHIHTHIAHILDLLVASITFINIVRSYLSDTSVIGEVKTVSGASLNGCSLNGCYQCWVLWDQFQVCGMCMSSSEILQPSITCGREAQVSTLRGEQQFVYLLTLHPFELGHIFFFQFVMHQPLCSL